MQRIRRKVGAIGPAHNSELVDLNLLEEVPIQERLEHGPEEAVRQIDDSTDAVLGYSGNTGGYDRTMHTVSILTRTTCPTRRTMYSGGPVRVRLRRSQRDRARTEAAAIRV